MFGQLNYCSLAQLSKLELLEDAACGKDDRVHYPCHSKRAANIRDGAPKVGVQGLLPHGILDGNGREVVPEPHCTWRMVVLVRLVRVGELERVLSWEAFKGLVDRRHDLEKIVMRVLRVVDWRLLAINGRVCSRNGISKRIERVERRKKSQGQTSAIFAVGKDGRK